MGQLIAYLVVKLAIGFICIAYPILTTVYVFTCPTYVIISFFVWIVVSLGYMCKTTGKSLKEYILPMVMFGCCFAIIFGFGSIQSDYFYSNDNSTAYFAFSFLCTALSLPSVIFIGLKLRPVYEDYQRNREKTVYDEITTNINKKISAISAFRFQFNRCNLSDKTTSAVVALLDICVHDDRLKKAYDNASDERFSNYIHKFADIIPKENMPVSRKEFDLYAEKQFEREAEYRMVLNNLDSYDYKILRKLCKEYKLK